MHIKDVIYAYKLAGGSKLAWHGRYHAHSTKDYELHLFLEGNGSFLLNSSKNAIEANRLFLVKPREFHSILPDAVRKPVSYYAVLFELDPDLDSDKEILTIFESQTSAFIELESREHFFAKELYRLYGGEKHNRAAEHLLFCLLYSWYGKAAPQDAFFEENRVEKNEHVERALILMGKLIQEKLSIDVLAGRLGLSSEHFIRLFRQKIGISPFQYFTRLKIEAASSFLVDTNLKVNVVAAHFGFENPFHFSKIFKKCTGFSPLEYRRTFRRPQPLL